MCTTGATNLDSVSTTDLAERVRIARSLARNLAGAIIDHRCGVCGRLDTDHVGNSSVGCTNANEIGEDALRHSLALELESADLLTAKVRGYDGLQQEMLEVTQRCSKAQLDLVQLTADYKEQISGMKEQVVKLKSSHREQMVKLEADYQSFRSKSEQVVDRLRLSEAKVDELETERSEVAKDVSQLWMELARGELSDDVMKRLLEDRHNIEIDDEILSFFHPRAPLIDTPTKVRPCPADADAGSAGNPPNPGGSGPAGGSSGSGPGAGIAPAPAPLGNPTAGADGPTGTSPATGQAYAEGGAPNGEIVGKSAKTIKVFFTRNDVAHQHVQKESSLLNEVGLIYPSSNLATLISIFISHCDPSTKDLAISVRDHVSSPFTDITGFLSAFRDARYPTFIDDCKLAYNELKQSQKESAVQFYYRFDYLLRAMSRNVEDYWDDFLKKIAYQKVRESVRLFPKTGRTVRDMATHCCLLENELGLRKLSYRNDAKFGFSAVNESDNNNNGGGKGKGKGNNDGGGKSSARRGRSKSRDKGSKGVFDTLGVWGIPKTSCFHCFDGDHSAKDGPCNGKPCMFCSKTGHQSIRCEKAPKTQEEFKKATKKSD